jgi:hypothetical protein
MEQTFKLPTLDEANFIMDEAEKRNPGPWVQHSLFAAQGAALIASRLPSLDPSAAYIMGYLHDIGRREGVTGMRHLIDGYNFLMSKGFDDAARICLTHSFPAKNIHEVYGKWDCSPEEFNFIQGFLSICEYTTYDRLIQLCDAICQPSGFCLMEKRIVDVVMRYGIHKYTVEKWIAQFAIQAEFEQVIGESIYKILPGVIENTFGFNIEETKQ